MAASDRLQGGFLLLDEPFGGAVQQEKLTPLYKRVSEAAASLGIQVIATTHHESAAECADNLIRLGCNAEIETV
jgi:ABC-type sulfate/molybdate transport systems ATPase subunit